MRTARAALALALGLAGLAVPARAPALELGDGVPDGGPALEPAPPASPEGHLYDWRGTPGDIPGRWVYSEGELILTDHPFDDHGADTDGSDGRSDNPTERDTLLMGANAAAGEAGDYVYPEGYARNSADIVEVRVAAGDDAWYVLVILSTLVDPDRTAIEIEEFDDLRSPCLSAIVHAGGATVDGVDVVADAEQNTVEARIPRAVCDPGPDARLFVGAGLWDPVAADWHAPAPSLPRYFDLAYTPDESMASYWRDEQQSRDLASASLGANRVPVDFECPVDDCDPRAVPVDNGTLFTRIFRSGQPLGEGVVEQTTWNQDESFDWFEYRSRYQPYAIYVPPEPSGGLVMLMHFLGGNHMSYPITSWPGLREWADPLGLIVAMPLGRGEAGWYEGPAEKDVFEVWRDVATHYAIDRERVYLAGMSMGGFGTWRLGQLYPDQFARAIVWSGPLTPFSISAYPVPVTYPQQNPPMCERDADGCGYSLHDLFGNAHNLPYLVIHGGADELVPSVGVETWMDEYDRLGATYRYVLYPGRRHETPYPGTTGAHVLSWLDGLPARDRDPVHVSYAIVRDLFQPAYGLAYDGTYWVDGMLLAEGATDGSIDAAVGTVVGETEERGGGVDGLGPYLTRGRSFRHGPLPEPALYVTARDLARAAIDTARIGWDPTATNVVQGLTEADAELVLRGDFPDDVAVSGAPFHRDGSAIVLELERGKFEVTLSPA